MAREAETALDQTITTPPPLLVEGTGEPGGIDRSRPSAGAGNSPNTSGVQHVVATVPCMELSIMNPRTPRTGCISSHRLGNLPFFTCVDVHRPSQRRSVPQAVDVDDPTPRKSQCT
eukprot:6498881-Pyramimonas_sp.AAC.1